MTLKLCISTDTVGIKNDKTQLSASVYCVCASDVPACAIILVTTSYIYWCHLLTDFFFIHSVCVSLCDVVFIACCCLVPVCVSHRGHTILCYCCAMTIKALEWIELKSWVEEFTAGFSMGAPVWCELGVYDLVSEPRKPFLSGTSKPCSSRLVSQNLTLHITCAQGEGKCISLIK